jgi:protein SCO1/2
MRNRQGNFCWLAGLGAGAMTLLTTGVVCADEPHAAHHAMMHNASAATPAPEVRVTLQDKILVTQDGESVRFARDVIGEHIVVMDFVYTTCTTICPVLSAVFGQLQDELGDALGTDVRLVSVSVDPGRDTPERLKRYGAKVGARPGWTWLTGQKSSVDEVLRGVGAYTPDFEDHPSMVLVGDPRAGKWTRFFGFPSPKQIMTVVDELRSARHGPMTD